MSQYRKGAHVRNQPQFDILSPIYSNPPVRPDADFVREHYCQRTFDRKESESENADVQGIVDGDSMLVVGHIIRRFV